MRPEKKKTPIQKPKEIVGPGYHFTKKFDDRGYVRSRSNYKNVSTFNLHHENGRLPPVPMKSQRLRSTTSAKNILVNSKLRRDHLKVTIDDDNY